MDTSNIPKAFWYSLSFCMVAGTLGLLMIAYRASSVSFEIANAKIELSSAIATTKEIKSNLEVENERLNVAKTALEQKLAALESENSPTSSKAKKVSPKNLEKHELLSGENPIIKKPVIPKDWFESLDAKINSAQQAIKK